MLISQYYGAQMDFVDRIEAGVERGKRLMSADIVVRRKHAMSQQKIFKRMAQFFKQVDGSYKKGDIKDKEGRVFARAYDKAVHGHFAKVREILSEVEGMAVVYTEFVGLEEEAKRQKKKLGKRKASIHALLEEAGSVKPLDGDYVKKHGEVLRSLEKAKGLRAEYIQKIRGKSVMEYVAMLKNKDLVKVGFPGADPADITKFLNAYPELSKATPEKLLEYRSWTDGKLKHTIPETKRFRSMMQEYGSWLERLEHLESLGFMVVRNVEDAKRLAPLFRGTEAGGVLSSLSGLGDYWMAPPKGAPVRDTPKLKKELSEIGRELALLEGV